MSLIFKNIDDIKINIISNIEKYIIEKDYIDFNNFDYKEIFPLIKGYLRELKKLNEIDDFNAAVFKDKITLSLYQNNDRKDIHIKIDNILRKIKILKIKSKK